MSGSDFPNHENDCRLFRATVAVVVDVTWLLILGLKEGEVQDRMKATHVLFLFLSLNKTRLTTSDVHQTL